MLYFSLQISKEKMNDIQKTTTNKRFAMLANLGEVVFHTKDLGNLWNIRNKNTLYVTLSRYKSLGIIYRICNGLYSIKNPKDIDPYLISVKFLRKYSYISCESILFNSGIINQPSREITLVSSVSKRFIILGQKFRSRKLKKIFLFNDCGIYLKNNIRFATTERAIADILYFNPKKYFDAFDSNLINWQKVNEISKQVGYNIKIPKIYDDTSK